MLADLIDSYIEMRRACGFAFESEGSCLRSFAAFSDSMAKNHVCNETALAWAAQAKSVQQRARRLGNVRRFARYARAEDARHEIPAAVFGSEKGPRPVPYILSEGDVQKLVHAAFLQGTHPLRQRTYGTLFALLACTGLRVSEALRLLYEDLTPDGLLIRNTKFRKSRLIPIHETCRLALDRYIEQRRSYAPFDRHIFVSLWRKPLGVKAVETAFDSAAKAAGLPCAPARPRPTPQSLRHTFAVRALENCPDSRDRITKHMVALSTYLGHCNVNHTYWYLEATPELMRGIVDCCESFFTGAMS
jgi:integrase/recombinase XerD